MEILSKCQNHLLTWLKYILKKFITWPFYVVTILLHFVSINGNAYEKNKKKQFKYDLCFSNNIIDVCIKISANIVIIKLWQSKIVYILLKDVHRFLRYAAFMISLVNKVLLFHWYIWKKILQFFHCIFFLTEWGHARVFLS